MNLIGELAKRIDRKKTWVFGIGLSRTGTSSLCEALKILGLKPIHLPPINSYEKFPQINLYWPWWVSKFNAAADISVTAVYRELADNFPNAKFIHTYRDMEPWLGSCERHTTLELANQRVDQGNLHLLQLRRAFYGSIVYEESLFRQKYANHLADVENFSRDRQVLDIDITKGGGWAELCGFLGRESPHEQFPSVNASK